jgi:hypothetical protein
LPKGEDEKKLKMDKKAYEGKPILKAYRKNPKTGKMEGQIKGGERLTIGDVEFAKLPKTGDTYILHFPQYDAGLPLNKTNAKALVEAWGDETDAWLNQDVEFRVVLAPNPSNGGIETESLRITPIIAKKKATKAKKVE